MKDFDSQHLCFDVSSVAGQAQLRSRRQRSGFTLIEMLAVIATIAILAALLLPTLAWAKERAKMSKCLNNFQQIGIAVQLYMEHNNDRYPPINITYGWQSFRLGGGDPDPILGAKYKLEKATNRVLWPYTRSRELYRCPADKGMNVMPAEQPIKNIYKTIGSSYKYNDSPWHPWTRVPQADPLMGIAGKPGNWVPEPSRFILLHEPPASPFFDGGGWIYFFWHYARGESTVVGKSELSDRFISPALFADGHAAKHDFTQSIKSNFDFPLEPTPGWIWYKPAPTPQP